MTKTVLRKIKQKPVPENIPTNDDEFFRWVGYAIPGMTSAGNIQAFGYAIKHLPSNDPIIEIGSFCGLSTIYISYFQKMFKKDNPFITSDKWEFEGQKPGQALGNSGAINHDQYKNFVKETYMRNVRAFCETLPKTIEVFSDEFFELWDGNSEKVDVFENKVKLGGPISFAFIDGNHTYDFAKRDFHNVDRYLVQGGFVLLDDSADHSHWEVNILAKEIVAKGEYELVSKNPHYLLKKK